jgi:hypothetical protein
MGTEPDFARVLLTNGSEALVSPEDYERVSRFRWYRTTLGYAVREEWVSGRRQTVWMHRFILDANPSLDVDHIDHDRLNNQRSNLRSCTRAQNLANARRHRDSTSPYKGVTWRKDIRRWTARIMVRGTVHHLGCFDTPEDARDAYLAAAQRLVGDFACAG